MAECGDSNIIPKKNTPHALMDEISLALRRLEQQRRDKPGHTVKKIAKQLRNDYTGDPHFEMQIDLELRRMAQTGAVVKNNLSKEAWRTADSKLIVQNLGQKNALRLAGQASHDGGHQLCEEQPSAVGLNFYNELPSTSRQTFSRDLGFLSDATDEDDDVGEDRNESNTASATASENSATTSKNRATTSKSRVTASKKSATTSKSRVTASKKSATTSKNRATTSKSRVTASKSKVTASKKRATTSKNRATTSKSRVTASKKSATTSKSRVTASKSRVTASKKSVTTSKNRATTSKSRVTACKSRVTASKNIAIASKKITKPSSTVVSDEFLVSPEVLALQDARMRDMSAQVLTAFNKNYTVSFVDHQGEFPRCPCQRCSALNSPRLRRHALQCDMASTPTLGPSQGHHASQASTSAQGHMASTSAQGHAPDHVASEASTLTQGHVEGHVASLASTSALGHAPDHVASQASTLTQRHSVRPEILKRAATPTPVDAEQGCTSVKCRRTNSAEDVCARETEIDYEEIKEPLNEADRYIQQVCEMEGGDGAWCCIM